MKNIIHKKKVPLGMPAHFLRKRSIHSLSLWIPKKKEKIEVKCFRSRNM